MRKFWIFWPKSNLIWPWSIFKKIFLFLPEFQCSNISAMTEHTQNQFFVSYVKKTNLMFTLVLFDGFIDCFSKFWLFIVENNFRLFWILYENYSAGWAYAETISSLAEHTRRRFHSTLSLRRTNIRVCSASVHILTVFTWTSKRMLIAELTRKRFHRLLGLRGNV